MGRGKAKSFVKVDPALKSALFQVWAPEPKKGDLRKLAVIDAAIQWIAERGIEEMNLGSVGEHLGIRRSHVTYYFKTLPELIDAVIEVVFVNAQRFTVERLEEASSGKERLKAFIEATFDWMEEYPSHAKVLLFYLYYCSHKNEHREKYMAIRRMGTERLEAILKEYCAETQRKFNDSHVEFAKVLQMVLISGVIQAFVLTREVSKKDFRELKDRVWGLVDLKFGK